MPSLKKQKFHLISTHLPAGRYHLNKKLNVYLYEQTLTRICLPGGCRCRHWSKYWSCINPEGAWLQAVLHTCTSLVRWRTQSLAGKDSRSGTHPRPPHTRVPWNRSMCSHMWNYSPLGLPHIFRSHMAMLRIHQYQLRRRIRYSRVRTSRYS